MIGNEDKSSAIRDLRSSQVCWSVEHGGILVKNLRSSLLILPEF